MTFNEALKAMQAGRLVGIGCECCAFMIKENELINEQGDKIVLPLAVILSDDWRLIPIS